MSSTRQMPVSAAGPSRNASAEAYVDTSKPEARSRRARLRRTLRSSDPRREQALEICRAGESAANLTRQLLAFSRRQILHPRVIDLNHVVLGLSEMLRRLLGSTVELVTVPAPDLHPIRVD